MGKLAVGSALRAIRGPGFDHLRGGGAGDADWRKAGIYRDEVTLFSHVVALSPEARKAHLYLGNALLETDRTVEGWPPAASWWCSDRSLPTRIPTTRA